MQRTCSRRGDGEITYLFKTRKIDEKREGQLAIFAAFPLLSASSPERRVKRWIRAFCVHPMPTFPVQLFFLVCYLWILQNLCLPSWYPFIFSILCALLWKSSHIILTHIYIYFFLYFVVAFVIFNALPWNSCLLVQNIRSFREEFFGLLKILIRFAGWKRKRKKNTHTLRWGTSSRAVQQGLRRRSGREPVSPVSTRTSLDRSDPTDVVINSTMYFSFSAEFRNPIRNLLLIFPHGEFTYSRKPKIGSWILEMIIFLQSEFSESNSLYRIFFLLALSVRKNVIVNYLEKF